MHVRVAAASLLLTTFTTFAMSKTSLLYIATQNPEKMGIAVAEFDPATGKLSAPKMIQETRDPAHFTVTPDGRLLYMCNTGTPGGVSAFQVKYRKTGALQFLNYREAQGRGPSFVSVDRTGHVVLDANYGGGYIEAFTVAKDGSLEAQSAFVQHAGSSVHPQRQQKPYAHWIHADPTNKFALTADLGMDEILVYRLDAATGKLTANDPPFVKTPPGTGPRHIAFHPNGKWVYATAELANEVLAFNWDAAQGTLTLFQEAKTLDPSFKDASTAAEIAVHSNGKYLYASNRGEDSIVVFAIDPANGTLTVKQRVSSRGKVPRYFTFDPTNKWLIVANQEGASVVVFSVNGATGELTPVGEPVALVKPMGVVFLP